MDEGGGGIDGVAGRPRKSWQMRKRQERAAIKEGLAEWQARVTIGVTATRISDIALADARAPGARRDLGRPRRAAGALLCCGSHGSRAGAGSALPLRKASLRGRQACKRVPLPCAPSSHLPAPDLKYLKSPDVLVGCQERDDCPFWCCPEPEQCESRAVPRAGQPVLLRWQGHCAGRHGHLCVHDLPERVRFGQCAQLSADLAKQAPGVSTPGQRARGKRKCPGVRGPRMQGDAARTCGCLSACLVQHPAAQPGDQSSNLLHCRAMLTELMTELAGDDGRPGGALLRQVEVPAALVGRTYGDLVAHLVLQRQLVPLGLYRKKPENPAWRLSYVQTNPPAGERVLASDRAFVLRTRHMA